MLTSIFYLSVHIDYFLVMKIIFICSSLEPGRDGAGDQTRGLAGELVRQGNQVAAISLNERNLTESNDGFQDAEGMTIPTLRLPETFTAIECYKLVAQWIRRFKPDWVSVQYVSFGFQRYGLPWGLAFYLRSAIGQSNLHIMLWELWCGMPQNAGIKEKALGALQKAFMRFMLIKLRPEIVSTSTLNYKIDLERIGVQADLIHVFGNIPLNIWGSDTAWHEVVVANKLSTLYEAPDEWLTLGFFGSVYACPGLEQLLQKAADAAAKMGRKLGVLSIGFGRGQDVGVLAQAISGTGYWKTGPLSPDMVNRAMHLVDMAVVTTNAAGFSKSSTAAAWMERGIPILVSAEDHTYNTSDMEHQGVFQVVKTSDVLKGFEHKKHLSAKSFLNDAVLTYSTLTPA